MFMRRMLKQGVMFQLDNGPPREDQQLNVSQNQFRVQNNDDAEDERRFRVNEMRPVIKSQYPQIDVQQLAMNNSAAVVVCGAVMCCLCSIIGTLIFYFFVLDLIKPYIPDLAYDYVPFLQRSPENFLTQHNAKKYFAQNKLLAGEFHYARVPVQYWPHRIQMIKSMGFNALSIYVFWNYHEVSKGVFDFQTQNKNLTHVLELAKIYDMDVLLRPGPYVCAEWDLGGLPPRLLSVKGIKLRNANQIFIQQTRIYFSQLSQVIKKYIKNSKNPLGPILMIQVQNEPSWVITDKAYINALKNLWDQINIGCPLYYDDIPDGYSNHTLYWDNAILGVNIMQFSFEEHQRYNELDHFIFYGEVYSGWFGSLAKGIWDSQKAKKSDQIFLKQFQDLLVHNLSFCMYVAHGGTNFALTAGFNLTTSYDYLAPINQQGRPTKNYYIFRSLIFDYTNIRPPKTPAPIQNMSASLGKTISIGSLFDNLPKPVLASNKETPLVFESQELQMFRQGLVLYETTIEGPYDYVYQIIVHDMAIIYLDGEFRQTIIRQKKQTDINMQTQILEIKCQKPTCKLEMLVEAFGHINFGLQISYDHKGILKFVQKQANRPAQLTLKQWKHYRFDVSAEPVWKNSVTCGKPPCLYFVEADLKQTKDTYINLQGLSKGYVWVNGRNLGRYWIGAGQKSLYCPGVWLTKGKNKILILDLYKKNADITIRASDKPV